MAQNSRRTAGNDLGLRTVLMARFSALGDVVMTIPVVYSACVCYPDVRFVMVTRPSMTGVFVNAPANLVVVGADVKGEYAGVKGIWRLVSRLRRDYDIDAFVDLHDVLRTKLMRGLLRMRGVKVAMLNKGRRHKRQLTRRYNKVMLPLTSTRARYREAFFRIGMPLQEHFNGLYGAGGKGEPELFAHITGGQKSQGEHWVGVAPFAAHQGKVYPTEKMEEVIEMLARRGDCRVYIFGGPGHEQEIAEGWAQKYPGVTSLSGKRYGFPVEMALLSHLDVMLTMDSANMHMASVTGTPTVSIWGATHHYCGFRGWKQREEDMVQLPLSCRPCSVFGDKPCYRHDRLCMTAIRPDTVYKKICEKIDKR